MQPIPSGSAGTPPTSTLSLASTPSPTSRGCGSPPPRKLSTTLDLKCLDEKSRNLRKQLTMASSR